MALIDYEMKMAYWKVQAGPIDLTKYYKKYTNSIDVTYDIAKPPTASISVNSDSFLESLVVKGQIIDIYFGYSPFNLVHMIKGKVMKTPSGNASEFLSLSIELMDAGASAASMVQNNRVFVGINKLMVACELIGYMGFLPSVVITDSRPIPANERPVQQKETDLACLYRLANLWGCGVWIDPTLKMIYFVEVDKIAEMGDFTRIPSLLDPLLYYELNYRTFGKKPNVEKVSWSFDSGQGGAAGMPGATGANEDGSKVLPTDYEYTVTTPDGALWALKNDVKAAAESSPSAAVELMAAVWDVQVKHTQATLTQFFVQVTQGKPTHDANKGAAATGSASGGEKLEVSVDLNYGDPRLRIPRTAVLSCGGGLTRNAELPSFVCPLGVKKYRIKNVKHSLSDGALKTSMSLCNL